MQVSDLPFDAQQGIGHLRQPITLRYLLLRHPVMLSPRISLAVGSVQAGRMVPGEIPGRADVPVKQSPAAKRRTVERDPCEWLPASRAPR